jgi:Cft2 family RNA processing exonuclease
MSWQVEATDGIFLPQIGWHLDARRRVAHSFVSHAHSDHIARHRHVLCTAATARLMRERLGGQRQETLLAFEETHELTDGTRVTLHPAGHILGSAQFRAENEHGALLYTGDFKLRPGRSAEACTTPRADTLIMETTFGRPHYVFPRDEDVRSDIVAFCRDAVTAGETPVLFAYSLGKSQELLCILADAGVPVMVHPQTERMNRVCEELGLAFATWHPFDAEAVAGHAIICPPQVGRSPWLRRLGPRRTAMVTGWGLDSGARYRYQCDAVFPLSDHAGFDDLLEFVFRVGPSRVYTVHGFAVDFAQELRRRGIEAWALGLPNQLELTLHTDLPSKLENL